MWTCLKCGRKFKNENQSHYCGSAIKTIDEYIEMQDIDIREILEDVRNVIKRAIPECTEKISWSMPTYWKNGNIIHFAANKKHLGLYPGKDAVIFFSDQLKKSGYKYNKGSIQVPYTNPLPFDLISNIAVWCYEQSAKENEVLTHEVKIK